MVFHVPLKKCRFPLHDIDVAHLWPGPSIKVTEGPIAVKLLDNGDYFVEDGRHRVIRGLLRGEEMIAADWLEEQDRKRHVILVDELLEEQEQDRKQDVALAALREALTVPLQMRTFTHTASCGKPHRHDPHQFGEHMEENCNGVPK